MEHKVAVCYLDIFLSTPTFRRIRNIQKVRDDWQIQIVLVAICIMIFGAHMNSEDSCAHYTRGDHSLLYFAYMCVRDLFIGGVIYLAKKIIR
jgi:hypothetical protein